MHSLFLMEDSLQKPRYSTGFYDKKQSNIWIK